MFQSIVRFVDRFQSLFDKNFEIRKRTGYMTVDQYFPPVAGALCYLMKLKRRIDYPIESMKLVDHPLSTGQSAQEIAAKYQELQVFIHQN